MLIKLVYSIEPEVYYLQTSFDNKDEFFEFEKALRDRSIYKFSTQIRKDDKIITLSTCTSDNKHRNVVHARLIKR